MPAVTIRIKDAADLLGTALIEGTDEDIEALQVELNLYTLGRNWLQVDVDKLFNPWGGALRKGNAVEVIFHAVSEDPIHSFFIEELEAVIAASPQDERGGRGSRFGGPGILSILGRARILPDFPMVDPETGMATWTDARPGDVIRELLLADRSSTGGLGVLDIVTWDFTGALDSDGTAWDAFEGEFSLPVGTDFVTAIGRLQMTQDFDVTMTPDLELHAYKALGNDLTGADWAPGVVRFQRGGGDIGGTITAGGNILTDRQVFTRSGKGKRKASHILVMGRSDAEDEEDRWILVERPSFNPATEEMRVLYHEYPDSNKLGTLNQVGLKILRDGEENQSISEFEVMPGDDESGDSNEIGVGLYLPGPSGTNGHYWLGDTPTTHTGVSFHDYNNAEVRITGIRVHLAEATSGESATDQARSLHSYIQLGAPQGRPILSLDGQAVLPGPARHTHPSKLCPPAIACRNLTSSYLAAATATNGGVESGTTNWAGGSQSSAMYHGGTKGYGVTSATSADLTYDFGSQSFTARVRYVLDIWRRMSGDHLSTVITFGSEGGDEEVGTYTGIVGDDDPALFDEYEVGADGQTWARARVCWTPSEDRTDVRVRTQVTANGSQDIAVDDLTLSTTTNNEYAGTSPKGARCDHTHHARSIPFSPRGDITATNVQTAIEQAAALGGSFDLPWVNVLDHGADPTGVADSLSAFNDALDTRTDRSAALIVPPGVYRMTGPLVLGNSTVILGIGANMENQDPGGGGGLLTYRPHSVLYFDNNTHGIISPDDAAVTYRCHHPVIESITVRGGGLAQGKIGIWMRDNASSSVAIQRVGLGEIRNCFIEYWGTAIDFDGTGDSCKVIGGHIHDCDKGFVGGVSEDVFDRVCVWDLATGPAVSLSGDRGQVIGCEIEPLVGSGIVLTSTAEFNRVVANDVKDVTGTAISVAGNNNVIVGNTGSRSVSTYYADTGTGNEWGHNTPTASFPAAGASDLDDLTDVTITSVAANDQLQYVGGVWVNNGRRWEPVVTDPGTGPELVFDGSGDIVMTFVEYS